MDKPASRSLRALAARLGTRVNTLKTLANESEKIESAAVTITKAKMKYQ
jgi:hypothetical protein